MSAVADYGTLLREALPKVIENDQQNEEYAARLEELVFKESLTPAEHNLVALYSLLIEEYERRRFPLVSATPIEMLEHIMESHGLKQKDLVDVFGAESTVSAVLSGKREMTRDHIKRLHERFGVSPAVFF
jgi:HTH-type transcriptional regulator / antitoxin HigA